MKIGLKFNFSDMVHGNTFKLFTMHHPLEYCYNKVWKTFEVYFKVNFEYLSVQNINSTQGSHFVSSQNPSV